MAWVLLAWWYSRGLSTVERGIALCYLVFVALATLGTGEHYFIDLVVAVPFALFMESLFAYDLPIANANRIRAIAFGLLSTCAWLAALRLTPHAFWSTPLLPWTLCAATIASGLYLETRLRRGTPTLRPTSQFQNGNIPPSDPIAAQAREPETYSPPVFAEIPKL